MITKFRNKTKLAAAILLSTIVLNTQTSFAKEWNEGLYLGLSHVTEENRHSELLNNGATVPTKYTQNKDSNYGIKFGYSKMLKNNFFVGPEFSYLSHVIDFDDSASGGAKDVVNINDNYNFGLRAGYNLNETIAFVIGYGQSIQTVKTFADDTDITTNVKNGAYNSYGVLFNLGNSFNLEFAHKENDIRESINKPVGTDGRNAHSIDIGKIRSNTITISKSF